MEVRGLVIFQIQLTACGANPTQLINFTLMWAQFFSPLLLLLRLFHFGSRARIVHHIRDSGCYFPACWRWRGCGRGPGTKSVVTSKDVDGLNGDALLLGERRVRVRVRAPPALKDPGQTGSYRWSRTCPGSPRFEALLDALGCRLTRRLGFARFRCLKTKMGWIRRRLKIWLSVHKSQMKASQEVAGTNHAAGKVFWRESFIKDH